MNNIIQNQDVRTNDLIIGDAALGRILGVSIVTINRLKKQNRLPYLKCGAKYRYILNDVLKAMQNEDYKQLTGEVV